MLVTFLQEALWQAITCYSDNNTLLYNQQTKTVTILLEPLRITECERLPQSIEAVLLADSMVQRRIVYDFDYATVTHVTFENVLVNISYGMSIFYMRGYYYEVAIQITNIVYELLALDNCFSSKSAIVFQDDQAYIELHSTHLCENVFTPGSGLSAALLVSGLIFELDAGLIIAGYSSISISLAVLGNFNTVWQTAFLNCSIAFSLNNSHDFEFVFTNVEVSGFGRVHTALGEFGLFDSPTLGLLKITGRFVIRIQVSAAFEAFEPVFSARPFTHYMYRLAVKAGNRILYLQKTTYANQFDGSIRFLVFSCNSKDKAEMRFCKEVYTYSDADSDAVLDLILFDASGVVRVEKLQLPVLHTCWNYSAIVQATKNVCIALYYDATQNCARYFPIPAGQQIEIELIQNNSFLEYTSENTYTAFTQRDTEYCRPYIAKINSHNKPALFLALTAADGTRIYAFADAVLSGDYRILQIVVFVVGGTFLAFCVANTVFGLVDAIRTILHSRKYIT